MKIDKNTEKFMACLTKPELIELRKEANERGLSVSDLLRRVIDKYLEDKKSFKNKLGK